MRAGIDIGYGYSKGVTDGKGVVFPSLVAPAEEFDFDAGLSDPVDLTLAINGFQYFVGEKAALHGRWAGRTLSRARVTTEEAKILFVSTLVHLFPEGKTNLKIVTGLPIAWMRDRDILEREWMGLHSARLPGQPPLRFNVSYLEVVPQAWGTLVREMFSHEGNKVKDRELFEGDVVLVDFGTLTTNFLSFSKRNYLHEESSSIDNAMTDLLTYLSRRLVEAYDLELPLHKVDEAMRQGFVRVYGDTYQIADLIQPEVKRLVDRALEEARTLWGDGKQKTRLLLTGGGAHVLADLFQKEYGHKHSQTVLDPQMANAHGLHLWAKMRESYA